MTHNYGDPMVSSRQFNLAIFCFFLSGVSALIYEICWIKKTSLIFGSSIFALSTVLAIFFAGLAIGNFVFGRIGQRLQQPIRCYAVLEISLAVFALSSPTLFEGLDSLYGSFFRNTNTGSIYSISIRFMLLAIVLLPPTILMGGTLPLFCRQLVNSNETIAKRVGLLYGMNTLGAVGGCLLAGFILIPEIGIFYSICLAAGINILAALIASSLTLRAPSCTQQNQPTESKRQHAKGKDRYDHSSNYPPWLLGILFFMVGFVSIGNEIVWTRFLSLFIRNSVYTYTITLSVVLSGIVVGSLVASRLFDKAWPLMRIFAVLQLVSAALTLILMTLTPATWQSFGKGFAPFFVLISIPACLAGACFPLLNRVALKNYRESSKVVGTLTSLNIAGGIAGSLFGGFIGLPTLGLHSTLLIMSSVGALSGLFAILPTADKNATKGQTRFTPGIRTCFIASSAMVFGAILMTNETRLPKSYLGPESLLVDYQEGFGTLLSVVKKGSTKQLQINRLWQGTDAKNHQIMAAHIPMALHRDPKEVLVIGLGVGQTPSRFLYHDIKKLDVVDIEPKIFDFVEANFDTEWMKDARVRLISEDGRTYVNHTENQYDVISIEVGQVFRPSVEAFYSIEFYEHAKRHLRPGGIVAQFVPLAFFKIDQFRSILATFQAIFPESVLWYNTQEILLMGSTDSLKLSAERLSHILLQPKINHDLEYSPWGGKPHWLNQPEAFLGGFISHHDQIRAMAASAPVYRDDRPVLAYQVANTQHYNHNEIPISKMLFDRKSAVSAILSKPISETLKRKVAWFQNRNLNDLIANAYLTEVVYLEHRERPESLITRLEEAILLNPDNAMANSMMGNVLLRIRRPDKAVKFFEKSVQLRKDEAVAQRGLAITYGQLRRFDEALRVARNVLNVMPDDPITLNLIGLVLAGKGRVPEAIGYLEKSLAIDPSNQRTAENLALARRLRES